MLVGSFLLWYTYSMEIILKTEAAASDRKLNINKSMTLEELAEYTGPNKYKILLAKVNGRDTELTETLEDGDVVELLDMRTHSADLVYQRGLTLLYLAAVRDVYAARGTEGVKVEIDNSLNKGFFTKIKCRGETSLDTGALCDISYKDIEEIKDRMRELVELDLPIVKEVMSKEDGVKIWNEAGYPEKARLLEEVSDESYRAYFYRIDVEVGGESRPYRNFFFGPMAPSLGYTDLFELRKYKHGILLRFPYYDRPDVIPKYTDDAKMYEAFEEEYRWLTLLGTQYLADMNRVIAEGESRDMILLSEALHEKRIAEIADEISRKGKRIILIAGPSSSGKTTFARRLCIQLRVNGLLPLYLGTDDYFLNRENTPTDENGEKNYENLEALDIDLFSQNMNDLLDGKLVDIPEFDFIDGVKVFGNRITRIDRDQPIIIEGIHALNGKLTEQISDDEKFKIYISPLTQLNIDSHNRVPTTDARMLRRMIRDYKYRGHSPAGTIRAWPKVRAGEDRNVFPYSREADMVFNSTLAYETCLLKKYAMPLLESIGTDEPEYSEARRLLNFFRFFREIEEEDDVPNNSILREFIGGSVFVE